PSRSLSGPWYRPSCPTRSWTCPRSVPRRVGVDAPALIERADPPHVVWRQLEREDVEVLAHPVLPGRLRYRHEPQLEVPPEDHLGGRARVGLSDLADDRVSQQVAA